MANAFIEHAAFLKIYSSYVNSFDSALTHLQGWTSDPPSKSPSTERKMSSPSLTTTAEGMTAKEMSSTRKKKIKSWLKVPHIASFEGTKLTKSVTEVS